MKNIILSIIASCIFSVNLSSQDFAPIGATWHYTETFPFDGSISFATIQSEKDTLFQGKNCRKLIKSSEESCSYRNLETYIFTQNDTVFFWDHNFNEFQILYNFGAKKGETWTMKIVNNDPSKTDTLFATVDSTSTTLINEIALKTLHISYRIQDWTYQSTIIEQLGDIKYMFNWYPISRICDGNAIGGLRCYKDNELGQYSSGISESCEYSYNWNKDYSFAPIGAIWHYTEKFSATENINFFRVKSIKDTLFMGKKCRKLIKRHHIICGDRPTTEFVYTSNDTTFFWDPNFNEFQILYNFNAKKDESWDIKLKINEETKILTVTVDSVGHLTEDYAELKKLYVEYKTDYGTYHSTIIEKFGDTNDMFNWQYLVSGDCDSNYAAGLRCYFDQQTGPYPRDQSIDCEYIRTDISNIQDLDIKIYPNPTKFNINIETPYQEKIQADIFNIHGQKMLSNTFFQQLKWDISTLSNGIYFIVLKNDNGIQVYEKLIVQ